jgi:hypothetical protein
MTANKRKNIINAIQDCLEEQAYKLSEWESSFLEDISKKLSEDKDLTTRQYDKLTDIIGFDFLK